MSIAKYLSFNIFQKTKTLESHTKNDIDIQSPLQEDLTQKPGEYLLKYFSPFSC